MNNKKTLPFLFFLSTLITAFMASPAMTDDARPKASVKSIQDHWDELSMEHLCNTLTREGKIPARPRAGFGPYEHLTFAGQLLQLEKGAFADVVARKLGFSSEEQSAISAAKSRISAGHIQEGLVSIWKIYALGITVNGSWGKAPDIEANVTMAKRTLGLHNDTSFHSVIGRLGSQARLYSQASFDILQELNLVHLARHELSYRIAELLYSKEKKGTFTSKQVSDFLRNPLLTFSPGDSSTSDVLAQCVSRSHAILQPLAEATIRSMSVAELSQEFSSGTNFSCIPDDRVRSFVHEILMCVHSSSIACTRAEKMFAGSRFTVCARIVDLRQLSYIMREALQWTCNVSPMAERIEGMWGVNFRAGTPKPLGDRMKVFPRTAKGKKTSRLMQPTGIIADITSKAVKGVTVKAQGTPGVFLCKADAPEPWGSVKISTDRTALPMWIFPCLVPAETDENELLFPVADPSPSFGGFGGSGGLREHIANATPGLKAAQNVKFYRGKVVKKKARPGTKKAITATASTTTPEEARAIAADRYAAATTSAAQRRIEDMLGLAAHAEHDATESAELTALRARGRELADGRGREPETAAAAASSASATSDESAAEAKTSASVCARETTPARRAAIALLPADSRAFFAQLVRGEGIGSLHLSPRHYVGHLKRLAAALGETVRGNGGSLVHVPIPGGGSFLTHLPHASYDQTPTQTLDRLGENLRNPHVGGFTPKDFVDDGEASAGAAE